MELRSEGDTKTCPSGSHKLTRVVDRRHNVSESQEHQETRIQRSGSIITVDKSTRRGHT